MASIWEHLSEDRRMLGNEYPEVHMLLDQFAHYPDRKFLAQHRKFLHHHEGIEYIRMRWGDKAARAAELHVIRDTGRIPRAEDYYLGIVDGFGYETEGR